MVSMYMFVCLYNWFYLVLFGFPIVAPLDGVMTVWLHSIVQLVRLIRKTSPPAFSDTADHQPSPWYPCLQLRNTWPPAFSDIADYQTSPWYTCLQPRNTCPPAFSDIADHQLSPWYTCLQISNTWPPVFSDTADHQPPVHQLNLVSASAASAHNTWS